MTSAIVIVVVVLVLALGLSAGYYPTPKNGCRCELDGLERHEYPTEFGRCYCGRRVMR